MSEVLRYVRVRMLISSVFDGPVPGNRMVDFYCDKRMHSAKLEIHDIEKAKEVKCMITMCGD